MILSGGKNNNTGPRNEGSGDRSLSKKTPGFFDSNKAPGFPGALCCSAGD